MGVEGLLYTIFPSDEELSSRSSDVGFLLSPMAVIVLVIGCPVRDDTFSTVAL